MPQDRKQILLPTDHHLLVTLRATTYCRVVLGPGALAATGFDAACHRRDDHRHARFAQAVVTDQTCCITPFRLTTIYLSRFARSLLAVWSSSLELWQPCCASSVSSTSANEMGKGVVIPSTVYLIRQTAIYEGAIKHSMLSLYQRTCYASRNPTHSVAVARVLAPTGTHHRPAPLRPDRIRVNMRDQLQSKVHARNTNQCEDTVTKPAESDER